MRHRIIDHTIKAGSTYDKVKKKILDFKLTKDTDYNIQWILSYPMSETEQG